MAKLMKIKVSIEGLELPPPDAERPIQELVSIVVQNLMHSYAKNGINQSERKQYYRLVSAFDAGVKSKAEVIELEDEDVGFLRTCCREARMIPNRLLERVEIAIAEIKDR